MTMAAYGTRLAVVEDLKESLELARTLWRLPSQAEPWIKYAPPLWATKEEVKKIKDMSELDFAWAHRSHGRRRFRPILDIFLEEKIANGFELAVEELLTRSRSKLGS